MPTSPDAWKRYEQRLAELKEARVNFDVAKRHEATEANGWHLDAYETDLPPEPPGAPEPDGAFALACGVLRRYEFPDPSLITGIFVPDAPLENRPMLLRGRFLGLSFYFGVRVGEVTDEERGVGAERARVWGYNYRTLDGHFERGEITFEVWKYAETGRVVFRVRAFSQTGRIANPFHRLGFRIFGRGLQRRFARTALTRMRRFVEEGLAARRAGTTPPPRETVDVEQGSAEVGKRGGAEGRSKG